MNSSSSRPEMIFVLTVNGVPLSSSLFFFFYISLVFKSKHSEVAWLDLWKDKPIQNWTSYIVWSFVRGPDLVGYPALVFFHDMDVDASPQWFCQGQELPDLSKEAAYKIQEHG